ncbi:hypothetical protein [Xanthomonas arboricola]|nr:hypothetical protein [Xanthomonas arboricola]NJB77830.1 hypothetical protein [Xanthomonas arboricola]
MSLLFDALPPDPHKPVLEIVARHADVANRHRLHAIAQKPPQCSPPV